MTVTLRPRSKQAAPARSPLIRRSRSGGLSRAVGVPGLFATAYGNVGSSIYYAQAGGSSSFARHAFNELVRRRDWVEPVAREVSRDAHGRVMFIHETERAAA